jgi:hypothetical protein
MKIQKPEYLKKQLFLCIRHLILWKNREFNMFLHCKDYNLFLFGLLAIGGFLVKPLKGCSFCRSGPLVNHAYPQGPHLYRWKVTVSLLLQLLGFDGKV